MDDAWVYILSVGTISQAAAMLGRLGGFAKSRKKIAAAKKNGKKGGRPPGSKNKKKATAFFKTSD